MSYLRKRGKNSWAFQIEYPPDPSTGKRDRGWVTVRGSKKDPERALTAAVYERDQGIDIRPDRVTIAGLLDRWLVDQVKGRGLEPGTKTRYAQATKRITGLIGSIRLQLLRPAHVQGCWARLQEHGLANSTIGVDARIFGQALRWAVRMQLIATNPADAVSPPSWERTESVTLSSANSARLLGVCDDPELRRIVYVALQTGLRISEILGLQWGDIDFDSGRAAIARAVKLIDGKHALRAPKSAHSRRSVALGEQTLTALREQRQWQRERRLQWGGAYVNHDLVFADPLGDIRPLHTVRVPFKRAARLTGFPDLRFHNLRHSSATLALKAGVHPRIVSERLGHASVAITMNVYSHVLPDMQRDAADALERLLPPALEA